MRTILVTACLCVLSPTCSAQFGFNYNANAEMASPDDNSYFHYYEQIDVKTSAHWVDIRANPNGQLYNVGWEMWVEVDGNSYHTDVAIGQTVTTDGFGVWHRDAHVTLGYCQRLIPANTYPAGEPVAHYGNLWSAIWLGSLTKSDSSPSRRFDVGS